MTEEEWIQVLARAAWGEKPLPQWIEPPLPASYVSMTENEWLTCDDPRPLLLFLQNKASDRKLRLFAVACCRAIWDLLPSEECREKVEVAEMFADGRVAQYALDRTYKNGYPIGKGLSIDEWRKGYASFACFKAAEKNAWEAATHSLSDSTHARSYPEHGRYGLSQVVRIHCIFGNPFRPINKSPAWLAWNDGTVRKVAQSIYEERAFDRMPILVDALEDAGCDNADILNHCRSNSPHVKGCWVVDALLGKE